MFLIFKISSFVTLIWCNCLTYLMNLMKSMKLLNDMIFFDKKNIMKSVWLIILDLFLLSAASKAFYGCYSSFIPSFTLFFWYNLWHMRKDILLWKSKNLSYFANVNKLVESILTFLYLCYWIFTKRGHL